MVLRKCGGCVLVSSGSRLRSVVGSCEHGNESLASKNGEFLD